MATKRCLLTNRTFVIAAEMRQKIAYTPTTASREAEKEAPVVFYPTATYFAVRVNHATFFLGWRVAFSRSSFYCSATASALPGVEDVTATTFRERTKALCFYSLVITNTFPGVVASRATALAIMIIGTPLNVSLTTFTFPRTENRTATTFCVSVGTEK